MTRIRAVVAFLGLIVAGAVTAGIAQQSEGIPRGRPVRPAGEPASQKPNLWQILEPRPAPRVPLKPDEEEVDVWEAANSVPVGSGDLDPTIDVQITQEIIDKAAELGTAAAMYEFVRNECAFQAYFGSQKGSVETLRQRAGNDYDLASLLIALLRASGIPARAWPGPRSGPSPCPSPPTSTRWRTTPTSTSTRSGASRRARPST